jgi:uracil-DNA glycosylase family 4
MFIGEAPGRLGADKSGIPFHGDRSGHNFEALLDQVGLSRYSIFVTNSVLCNPKDDDGNNSPPKPLEIQNCSSFLRRQIDLIAPKIVVSLGGKSLQALALIEEHNLTLQAHVRTARKWYGRTLIPAYHPGQRAMIHRSFANQLSDYQFIAEQFRRIGKPRRIASSSLKTDVRSVVVSILKHQSDVSYFGLHKLFYLVELFAVRRLGSRLTNAYIVRQKDGPYCTDLHYKKLRASLPELRMMNRRGSLILSLEQPQIFDPNSAGAGCDSRKVDEIVESVIGKYGTYNDAELKKSVYLTKPMRQILRAEKKGHLNLFNTPIDFTTEARPKP